MQNKKIIAHCGLICDDCWLYRKNKCGGCVSGSSRNRKCEIRKCNKEHGYTTCADCREFKNLEECKKLNNLISKFFSFIFKTNRIAKLTQIQKTSLEKLKSKKENVSRK